MSLDTISTNGWFGAVANPFGHGWGGDAYLGDPETTRADEEEAAARRRRRLKAKRLRRDEEELVLYL